MKPVVPGVWRVPLAGGTVNAYVLVEDDGLTLVDCGYPGSCETILRSLSGTGHSASDIRRLVITHADIDHMGSLADLRRRTGAEVLAHALEHDVIAGRKRRQWGTGPEGKLLAFAYQVLLRTGRINLEAATVDGTLNDGQSCGGSWQVVHTPGHTPGHIALYEPGQRVLITGDALGQRRGALRGPKPMYAANIKEAVSSVRKLAELRPETLLFGHRQPLRHLPQQALTDLADRLAPPYST